MSKATSPDTSSRGEESQTTPSGKPPAPCQPWCAWPETCAEVRASREIDADASCLSGEHDVPISSAPLVAWRRDDQFEPQALVVYADQAPSAAQPSVHLGVNDQAGVMLTPAEALALADALRKLVESVEQ